MKLTTWPMDHVWVFQHNGGATSAFSDVQHILPSIQMSYSGFRDTVIRPVALDEGASKLGYQVTFDGSKKHLLTFTKVRISNHPDHL